MPALLWVRAFEAAARHESFVGAGKELCVSAGAISRAVKLLEMFIGVELFVRRARGVTLTVAGRAYAGSITPAIRQIASASAALYSSARGGAGVSQVHVST
jgi:LysR family glycine cleavage system transcriptional activator